MHALLIAFMYKQCKNPAMPVHKILLSPGASPPTGVSAVQTGPTSIRVNWTPPTTLGDTTGYIISYTSDSDSDSVTVSDGSTAMEILTGLQNGDTYTISIVATSDTELPSESVMVAMDVGLGKSLNIAMFHEQQQKWKTCSVSTTCPLPKQLCGNGVKYAFVFLLCV